MKTLSNLHRRQTMMLIIDIQGVVNLYDRMERMYRYGPEFIDVTWGAGGVSADLTSEIVSTAQSVYGLETMMHLTCTNMPREQVDTALKVSLPRFYLVQIRSNQVSHSFLSFSSLPKNVVVKISWLFEGILQEVKIRGNLAKAASNMQKIL